MSRKGIGGGLANYGDQDFSLYLRRSFARSMGISDKLLNGPVVGIAAAESELLVSEEELKQRLAGHVVPQAPARGYAALYHNSVLQAPSGCDFDFLIGR